MKVRKFTNRPEEQELRLPLFCSLSLAEARSREGPVGDCLEVMGPGFAQSNWERRLSSSRSATCRGANGVVTVDE